MENIDKWHLKQKKLEENFSPIFLGYDMNKFGKSEEKINEWNICRFTRTHRKKRKW